MIPYNLIVTKVPAAHVASMIRTDLFFNFDVGSVRLISMTSYRIRNHQLFFPFLCYGVCSSTGYFGFFFFPNFLNAASAKCYLSHFLATKIVFVLNAPRCPKKRQLCWKVPKYGMFLSLLREAFKKKSMEHCWNDTDTGKTKYTKTCPSAILSITNLTWTDLESILCLRSERLMINHLNKIRWRVDQTA